MKFVIIFASILLISCEEDLRVPDKEYGLCVYKISPRCVNPKPWDCPPKLVYLTCITDSQRPQYSDVDLYKIDNCGCEL